MEVGHDSIYIYLQSCGRGKTMVNIAIFNFSSLLKTSITSFINLFGFCFFTVNCNL
jgi:hypothetical protein